MLSKLLDVSECPLVADRFPSSEAVLGLSQGVREVAAAHRRQIVRPESLIFFGATSLVLLLSKYLSSTPKHDH